MNRIKKWFQKHQFSVAVIPKDHRPVRVLQLNKIGIIVVIGGVLGSAGVGLYSLKTTPNLERKIARKIRPLRASMSPIDQKIEQIEIEQEILEEKLSRLNFPDGSSIESDPELGSFIQSQTPPDPALPTRNLDPKQAKLNQLEKRMLKVSKTIQVWEWAQSFIPSGWPVSGRISSPFGFRMHPMYGEPHFHRGIDIASDPGTPIQVTAEGTVAYSGWGGSYGYVILVAHAFGFSTLYGHTEQLFVEVGQRVSKGQLIALVGSTGAATGAHLHYEVRRWNQPILPNPFLGV